ncbi:hypothetical protein EON66_01945 [archaeon]|nr:MAG: hypothetical protein EON66_01945 [archaeon]
MHARCSPCLMYAHHVDVQCNAIASRACRWTAQTVTGCAPPFVRAFPHLPPVEHHTMSTESIRVFVRVRPPTEGERKASDGARVVSVVGNTVCVALEAKGSSYNTHVDAALDESAGQDDVFAPLAPLLRQTLSGINATVLAYGQTGTGKTHTILGSNVEEQFKGARGSAATPATCSASIKSGEGGGVAGVDESRWYVCTNITCAPSYATDL